MTTPQPEAKLSEEGRDMAARQSVERGCADAQERQTELLPCPFCGGTGLEMQVRMGMHSVVCQCDGEGPWAYDGPLARQHWNRRTPSPEWRPIESGERQCPQRFRIGQRVTVAITEDLGHWSYDWVGQVLWVAGVQFDGKKDGLNYTLSDTWPIVHLGNLTDGFGDRDLDPAPSSAMLSEAQRSTWTNPNPSLNQTPVGE